MAWRQPVLCPSKVGVLHHRLPVVRVARRPWRYSAPWQINRHSVRAAARHDSLITITAFVLMIDALDTLNTTNLTISLDNRGVCFVRIINVSIVALKLNNTVLDPLVARRIQNNFWESQADRHTGTCVRSTAAALTYHSLGVRKNDVPRGASSHVTQGGQGGQRKHEHQHQHTTEQRNHGTTPPPPPATTTTTRASKSHFFFVRIYAIRHYTPLFLAVLLYRGLCCVLGSALTFRGEAQA